METTLIFVFASVVITTLSLNFGFNNLLGKTRNELVFENKNKSYGAYDLRKSYGKNLGISLFITLIVVTMISWTPYLVNDTEEKVNTTNIISTEMLLPPPVDKQMEELPPPPPPAEEVKKTSIQFTTIEVTEEEILNPPPADTEMDRKKISTETVEGEEGLLNPTENTNTPVDIVVKKENAITFAEEMPKYPEDKMYEDLAKNIVYPEREKTFQIEGTLYISFVVEKDGSVSEVQVIREVEEGKGFNNTAINAVKNLKNFTPAKMNGNPVRLRMTIPIRFSLR